MKIVSKRFCSIWLGALFVVLSFALPVRPAGSSILPVAFGERIQVSFGYDEPSTSGFDYDSGYPYTTNEKENRAGRIGGVFHYFADFLAAKTPKPTWPSTAQQMDDFLSRFEPSVAWTIP